MREIARLYRATVRPGHGRAGKRGLVAVFRRMAASRPGPYAPAALSLDSTPTQGAGQSHRRSRAWRAPTPSTRPTPRPGCTAAPSPTAKVHGSAAPGPGPPDRARPGRASKDDAYLGPWQIATSSPLLIVGNFHDPATPISGARIANTCSTGRDLLSLEHVGSRGHRPKASA